MVMLHSTVRFSSTFLFWDQNRLCFKITKEKYDILVFKYNKEKEETQLAKTNLSVLIVFCFNFVTLV